MLCPNCATPMTRAERLGVAFAVCPQCGGTWLERGALARLLDNAAHGDSAAAPAAGHDDDRWAHRHPRD